MEHGDSNHTILTIPKPCHENWDLMTHSERGRFCKVCSKTVTDFTNSSREEIIHAITIANDQICGNIPTYHLAEVVNAKNSRFNYRSLFFGLLALFGVGFATTDKVNAQHFQKISVTSSQDSTTEIRGTIIDSVTRKPLDYASIQIKLNGIVVCQTLSDDEGAFSCKPLKNASQYTIEVSYIGYGSLIINNIATVQGKTTDIQIVMKTNGHAGILGEAKRMGKPRLINPSIPSGKTFDRDELHRMGY